MTSDPSQPTNAELLEAINGLRSDVDQQFVDLATDLNDHLNSQDRQTDELVSLLKTRFDRIDARLEELAQPQQLVTMPVPRIKTA
jgi:hypothetical protein